MQQQKETERAIIQKEKVMVNVGSVGDGVIRDESAKRSSNAWGRDKINMNKYQHSKAMQRMANVGHGVEAKEKEAKASHITMAKDIKVIDLQGRQLESA